MLSNSTDRSRSRSLIVLGVLLAAVFACFWPLIKHPGWLLVGFQRGVVNDLIAWFLPRRAVPHFAWSQYGELPFWCPWWGGGSPLLGNPQASIFYPLNWPLSVLNVAATISWSFVVHHLIAASGAYALCRKLGGTVIGSTFAAVAFGFSPVRLARTSEGQLATLSVASWFPWAFSMYQGFRKGSHRSALALVGILALAIFAGHLQESYYLILTLTAVCACEALRYATAGQSVRALRLMGGWALIGIATAGLVAVELIPLTTYLNEAVQSARLRSREQGTPGLSNLLQLLHPFALGDPAQYKGPRTHYWESICHFGLVALGLAVAGVVASIGERRPIGQLAGVGAGSFVLAFGHRVPVLGTLAN